MLKPLPIGIQTYSDLINNGFLYIDKTEYIYNMSLLQKYQFVKSLKLLFYSEVIFFRYFKTVFVKK